MPKMGFKSKQSIFGYGLENKSGSEFNVQIAHRELSGGSQTVKNEKLLKDIIPKVGSRS